MQSQTQTTSQSTVEGEVSPEHLVVGRKYVRINVDGGDQYTLGPSKLLERPTQTTVKFDAGYGATVTFVVNAFRYFEPSAAPEQPRVEREVSSNVNAFRYFEPSAASEQPRVVSEVSSNDCLHIAQRLARYENLVLRDHLLEQLPSEKRGRIIELINRERNS